MHREDIDPQHGKLLFRVRLQKAAAGAEARVVDEEIDPLVGEGGAERVALRIAGKVGGEDAAGDGVLGREFGGKGIQPVLPAGGQDEPEAQLCVPAGKLLPDAGGCAGDPDGFVFMACPFSILHCFSYVYSNTPKSQNP